MQGTQLWSPIFAHVRSKCCNVASLFVGSSSEDESVFELGFWHVQKGICSSLRLHIHKQKNIVLLCLLGSSFEDESVFGLRLWQVQKVVCSSLCLHIRKPKNLPRVLQKNSHPPTCCHIIPDPPAPPWSMLLPNACRHPNRNGCFFWRPFEAKRCNNIELGEGGMQVSSQWVWQDGCFFWRTRYLCYIYLLLNIILTITYNCKTWVIRYLTGL